MFEELVPSSSDLTDKIEEKRSTQAWLFFWLGNACLLAYNIAINAIDIYVVLTKNQNVGNDLNRAYNFPCSFMALILCFVTIKNYKAMFVISHLILIAIMCILPILLIVQMNGDVVYWVTIILFGISGIFSSCIMSAAFSVSTKFSEQSSTYISSGNGFCGVLAGLLRVITKAAFSSDKMEKISSSLYFFLAALILLGTLIFFLYKMRDSEVSKKFERTEGENAGSIKLSDIWSTMKVIWPLWLSEALDFMITLTIFPGYVCATTGGLFKSWNSVIITNVFNAFDWIGRSLPSLFIWPSLKYAAYPMWGRLIFFPLEILSLQNIVNMGEPWFTVFMQIPFALTNGYFGTVCMIYGSNHPNLTAEQKAVSGFLMTFAINAGILLAMGFTYAMPIPKV